MVSTDRMRAAALAACVASLALSGCGHIPDAKLTYYHAQSNVSVKVVRTVMCDAKDFPVVANAVTPAVTHAARHDEPHTVDLSKLRGAFSNSDFKVELTEDGRLTGVNATTVGQGENILKTVATLSSTIVAFDAQPRSFPAECAFIKEAAGAGKPLTVTYEGAVDITRIGQSQAIKPEASSSVYAGRLREAIGDVCAVVVSTAAPPAPAQHTAKEGELLLRVKQPGWADVAVRVARSAGSCAADTLWSGRLPVAQVGTAYDLPIPKPAAFGKQVFAASFAESGALKSLQYASENGAAQATGALNSFLTMAQGETTAQKLAAVKNEADLIAQQQRLVQCIADPKSCK